MQEQILRAYAKLNLTLDVIKKREDGYHELDMLMTKISLHDVIAFTPAPENDICYHNMEKPRNDIIRRAIEAYCAYAGKRCCAHIRVDKRIPVEAGLGGGSADAAAVLNALQDHYRALTQLQLNEAALLIGADVPYCLQAQPCRAQGIGEKLRPLQAPLTPYWFVIAKPTGGISTAELFSRLSLPVAHPDTDAAQRAFQAGEQAVLGRLLCNALMPAAAKLHPEIQMLIDGLFSAGALGASMTGAGSAVFGLFSNEQDAECAVNKMKIAAFYTVASSI